MRRAFSLIELLVVVSIIALLIAILLPILARARNSAMDTNCMANMKSLILAQTAYTVEHDGYFPHTDEWIWNKPNLNDHPLGNHVAGGKPWDYKRTVDYTSTLAPLYGVITPYLKDFNAHFCPLAPIMPVNGLKKIGGAAVVPEGDKVIRSYVQSQYIGPDKWYTTLEQIKTPSELLVLTEENTFSMNFNLMNPRPKTHFGPVPMNDGRLDPAWDAIGSIHRLTQGDNLRSGYAAAAFADASVDWAFSQADAAYGINATTGFIRDDVNNPEKIDPRFIDDSMDYTYVY